MAPPEYSPVGTMIDWFAEAVGGVMSTIFASGVSTETPVTLAVRFPLLLVNVNVAPCAERLTSHPHRYASRQVAEPLTKSPTDPPSDAEAMVAFPLNDIGPLMLRAPL